jgi:glycosyltransferase involved in cell wall biosynthesis
VNCDLPEFFVALSRIKSKIVILDHTTRPWETRKFLGKMIRMILSTRGAFWVNVSSKLPPKESNYLGVIPNIVDQESLIGNPKRNQMTLPPRLVYLGRLSKEKRPDIFLELALSLKYPALVIGDGPLRQDLENSIPPDAEIEFLGHIRSPWELISSNDLVIVTSEYEGDGLVPLEAAALGIPVALRNVSDLRGLGFPPQTYFANIPELGKKIQESGFSGFLLTKDDSYRILKGRASSAVYESWKNLFRI